MIRYRTRSVVDREVQTTLERVRNFVLQQAQKIPKEVMYSSQQETFRWIEKQLGLQDSILDQKQYQNCVAEWLDEMLEWYNKKQNGQQIFQNQNKNSKKRTRSGRTIKVNIQQYCDDNDDMDIDLSDEQSDDEDYLVPVSVPNQSTVRTRSSKRIKLNCNLNQKNGGVINGKNTQNKAEKNIYQKSNSSDVHSNNASLLDLPAIFFEKIASKLDHDSLFLFFQTNKQINRTLKESSMIWQNQCDQKGWKITHENSDADLVDDQNNCNDEKLWKETYKSNYQKSCFNCFTETDNFTFSFGKLCFRVCRQCSRSALITERKAHRLITKSGSKFRYKVNDKELDKIDYALVPNMENALFNLTCLYRKVDVVNLAVQKWGTKIARTQKFIEPKL